MQTAKEKAEYTVHIKVENEMSSRVMRKVFPAAANNKLRDATNMYNWKTMSWHPSHSAHINRRLNVCE